MRADEALQIIGDWISDETRKRKYAKITLIELADALITLKDAIRGLSDENDRTYKRRNKIKY